MSEKELKKKVGELKHVIEEKKKEVRELQSQLSHLRRESSEFRTKRDQLNAKAKEFSTQAKEAIQKRNGLNKQIAELKKKRREQISKMKALAGHIKESKRKRDDLNRSARGTDEILQERFQRDLGLLLNEDIPLEQEMKLFERVLEVKDRLASAELATGLHQKVVDNYSKLKDINIAADEFTRQIQELAAQSDKHHEEAMTMFKEIKPLRAQSDELHCRVVEKYEAMKPLRDSVAQVREAIEKLREEMAPHIDELEKIRLERERKKKAETAKEVREKIGKKKRISLEDFRVLLEQGESLSPDLSQ